MPSWPTNDQANLPGVRGEEIDSTRNPARQHRVRLSALLASLLEEVPRCHLTEQNDEVSETVKHDWEKDSFAFQIHPCKKEATNKVFWAGVTIDNV